MSKSATVLKVLQSLRAEPVPLLGPSVRSLRITLAKTNAHYGARHFVKEELPRVAYNNPGLKIDVMREEKKADETWKPELIIEHANGASQTINMDHLNSKTILSELLHAGNGTSASTSSTA